MKEFIQEQIEDAIDYVRWKANNAWWWVMHRIHPSHRYNMIKIRSLKPGYYDPSTRMVHACFDLVAEYVEERIIPYGVTLDDIKRAEERDAAFEVRLLKDQYEYEREVVALAEWWKEYLSKHDKIWDSVPDLPDGKAISGLLDRGNSIDPDIVEYRRKMRMADKTEQQLERDLREKFHRLVDISQHLWY